MSEILKQAYARPLALTQNRYHHLINKGTVPKYIFDFYPIAQEYYHEFNPYFVHTIARDSLFSEFKVFTVRDGMYTFADFVLKYLKEIPKWKTTFLVPGAYAPIVPPQLKSQFLSYSLSQNRAPDIRKAKTVVIFALLCDQYFSSFEEIEKKLAGLRDLPPDATIEVCISLRRSPLLTDEKENLYYVQIPELIRKYTGNREIKWLRMRDLMEKTALNDVYLLDLLHGFTLTCDSYLHFFFLNKGGMVNILPVTPKKESLFEIDLSFGQKLHVNHLPETSKNGFVDLLFFSKMTKGDLSMNPKFHAEVRNHVTSSAYHSS